MSATGDPITILSAHESWNLLAAVALGRLVTSVDGQPEIFPANFVVQHRTVLFRTAEGSSASDTTRLLMAALANLVPRSRDNAGESRRAGYSPSAVGPQLFRSILVPHNCSATELRPLDFRPARCP